ncbi:helix-turn-helix domain-containing protein [Nocardioides sp.]|uniref:AraC family transcriptional regulator n=1 Tax=Nocardioides sp. TaxID=35761 RepID=UPI0035B180BE
MHTSRPTRGAPEAYDFEGEGDVARAWLDTTYGTSFRLSGRLGTVRHHREDHGAIAFDHLKIDARFTIDSDPMPVLVVVDLLRGSSEYTRGLVTDRIHDGDSVVVSGWDMPFTGSSESLEVRDTSFTAEALTSAVEDVVPDYPWEHVTFTSYVPHSRAAGARWRATVDHLSAAFPGEEAPLARSAASRLLGHTLLHTFPNNVVGDPSAEPRGVDSSDATTATLRKAAGFIDEHAHEDLSVAALARACGVTPRALQYAFRRHLGCTPMAYLRRVRLDLVRQALRDGTALTVSDAAARYGFFNPGRFAAGYRQVFDERPTDTLHRSHS